MKLDKLTSLKVALDNEFSQINVKCVINFKNDDQWVDLDGGIVAAPIAQGLEKSKSEAIAYHTSGSKTARYYIKEFEAVVSLSFTKSPQLETRKRHRAAIEKIQEAASNAYRVSHHSLTHLLAKDAFRDLLKLSIKHMNDKPSNDLEAQEIEQPNVLAVMALDIDYFKQVNDTWGHLYGDQVLKIFGKRLEKCASNIKGTAPLSIIHIGHPSGEEFLISLTASASKEQFSIWANQFRISICEEVLPTDVEWQWLCKNDNLSALSPPPIPDRAVSTSIGIAFHTGIAQLDSSEDPSAALLDLADTALYRAKAAGRNQVIFYDDILSNCGRIIEQDSKTGVVAIDIGSNVGVNIGQEFKVYHPTFTGKKKFSINDGRTTRTLGFYPRVESSRIVVFNAQPEVAFAYIDAADNTKVEIDAGSHLEAIPAGSIGHLLPNNSRYLGSESESLRSADINALQDFVKGLIEKSETPYAIVVRFAREVEYMRKYGTAALNKALARLYRGAQVSFPQPNIIAVLDSGSICIVGIDASYSEPNLLNFTKEIATEYPALEVTAGVFCTDDLENVKEVNGITLDPMGAIEFARFSASESARQKDAPISHFSIKIAMRSLQGAHKAKSFDVAYTDFTQLIKLGVESAPIYNLGGLIAGRLGLNQKALDYYQIAISKDLSKTMYKTNYAIMALKIGDIDLGLKMLSMLTSNDVEKLLEIHPFGFFAYATLLAKAKLTGSHFFDRKIFSEIAGRAIALPEAENLTSYVHEIENALNDI